MGTVNFYQLKRLVNVPDEDGEYNPAFYDWERVHDSMNLDVINKRVANYGASTVIEVWTVHDGKEEFRVLHVARKRQIGVFSVVIDDNFLTALSIPVSVLRINGSVLNHAYDTTSLDIWRYIRFYLLGEHSEDYTLIKCESCGNYDLDGYDTEERYFLEEEQGILCESCWYKKRGKLIYEVFESAIENLPNEVYFSGFDNGDYYDDSCGVIEYSRGVEFRGGSMIPNMSIENLHPNDIEVGGDILITYEISRDDLSVYGSFLPVVGGFWTDERIEILGPNKGLRGYFDIDSRQWHFEIESY